MDEEENEDDFFELNQKVDSLEEVARKCGVYLEDASVILLPTPMGPRQAIVANFTVGDVAFARRVQDPEQDQIDKAFQQMTHTLGMDEFLETREQMKKNVAEGRNPLSKRDDDK